VQFKVGGDGGIDVKCVACGYPRSMPDGPGRKPARTTGKPGELTVSADEKCPKCKRTSRVRIAIKF
jgi:hypothetical protein